MSCPHPSVEPVLITNRDTAPIGQQRVTGKAFQCTLCHTTWPYVKVDDLPHWLWKRLGPARWMFDPIPQSLLTQQLRTR